MARTYATLSSLVSSKTGGSTGTLSESVLMANMNLALDYLRSMVDVPETTRTATLSPALFTDVIAYTPPTDLRDDKIIDIRPLIEIPNTPINNNQQRNTTVEFSNNLLGERWDRRFAIEYNNGTKILRQLNSLDGRTQNLTLNTCDTYTGDGTWTADTTNSDANTVATDSVNYFEGSGSVSFNITVAQSGNNRATIYNPSMTTKNISEMSNPYLFFYVYLPSVTEFTSVTFYVGSGSSLTPSTRANYYTFTATTQFDGSALVAGRNLIGVRLGSATETGTVDDTAISYLELQLNFTASYANQTGVLLDGIFFREGQLYEARYFTTNIVIPASGSNKAYFTANDDTTMFNPETEMLYVDLAAGYIAPNAHDFATGKTFSTIATESMMRYKAHFPQETRLLQKNWYY